MKKEKSTFGWIFTFAGSKKSGYIISVCLAVIGAAFQVLPFFVMATVISKLLTGNKNLSVYLIDCVVMALFWLLRVLFHSLSTAQSHKATFAVLGNIRKQGLDKFTRMPLGDVQTKGSGELKNILVERVDSIEPTLAHVIPEMSSNAIVVLVTFVYLLILDWRMALASLITFPLGMVFFILMMAGYNKNYVRTVTATNILNNTAVEYMGYFNENSLGAITSVTTNTMDNLSGVSTRVVMLVTEGIFSTMVMTLVIFLFDWRVGLFIIAGLLLYYFINHALQRKSEKTTNRKLVGDTEGLEQAGTQSSLLRVVDTCVNQATDILNLPAMDIYGAELKPDCYDLRAEDIHFSYGEKTIINGITLSIPERTTTAIVGPSGGGKTTLCHLLSRFWDVDSGCVTLGGYNVREYDMDSLMKNFSFVFQNVYLFHDTIANNIRFGQPDTSMEKVIETSQKACCHEFIMKLPKGYDTVIGEAGGSLSGGERQRLSIARAMMKDAPIIILDEATANIDPENEKELMEAVNELTHEKTVIMIAHRLKTVRNAAQILVVDNGQIIQHGTHDELMKQDGIYRHFITGREQAVGWKL